MSLETLTELDQELWLPHIMVGTFLEGTILILAVWRTWGFIAG
jgi:hypothetical protein